MGLRQERMADQIRDILALNFQGGQLNDPRLELVTLTAVKLTADLQLATIYYRTYDESAAAGAQRGLESASSLFRRQLGQALDIRRVPQLRYLYDKSLEHAARIETLLGEIASEESLEAESESDQQGKSKSTPG